MPVKLSLIAVFVLISNPVAAAATTSTPFSVADSGAVVIPVSVNGADPVPFLLDTGSTHSVVNAALARRLRLPLVAKTTVLTSTGHELRGVVKIASASIGPAVSEGLLASAVPDAQLAAIAHGVVGIIGQDFLYAFNYTLDYRRKRLTWSAEAVTGNAMRLPLIAHAGRWLVAVPDHPGDVPLLLVPDSGASDLVAFERAGRTRLALTPVNGSAEIVSISGRQHVRVMMLRELRLGSLTLRHRPVAVVEQDAADALEGDGLLPLHLFASVSFNATEGYLVLRRR